MLPEKGADGYVINTNGNATYGDVYDCISGGWHEKRGERKQGRRKKNQNDGNLAVFCSTDLDCDLKNCLIVKKIFTNIGTVIQ